MRRRTKDPKDRQGYNLGARYLVFLVITLGMFAYLLTGVFRLQVVESEEYVNDAESSRTTTITLRGSRGMITDADAVILARDADIYNVTFYREPEFRRAVPRADAEHRGDGRDHRAQRQ